ncbi:MAG: hypothetical protein A3D31_05030 [Candidatus Fluviicola riflensis]|nr:MAG: hypothetical protein CHH17_09990 [Candidatus Fluviicola riflensis]OGS79338.1 MAG: hypothetical protein A3D31_05030 [Candidatus Fluviicola riflensis]OGS86770.1 MAG: hypothetical protein A2724_04490 [Fluviicola sp. RIFCSPHIGHO2_01_FULL_43_53]OGS88757.1 MAG: hypothetical protein A3E30_00170 [Fluviicola sp. RIFCSPHIGHO2_12_FULL_43_24]
MQLKFRILHFFLVLLFGVLGIIGLVLFEVFGTETPPESILVPKAANWVVRLDASQLAKDETYTLLFETKDDSFFKELKNITDNRLEKRREYGSLAIDFSQPVLAFGVKENNTNYVGFLVKVLDEELFQKNIPKYLNSSQSFAVKNNTGLILSQLPKTSLSNKELKAIAEKFLNNSNTESTKTKGSKAFMSVDLPAKKNKKPAHFDLQHEPHQLSFSGHFTAEKNLKPANYSLKSNALLISTSIIPKGLSDSLNKLLPIGNYQFPELRAVTIDYQGVIVEKVKGGMLILPKINAIFETETPVLMKELFDSIPEDLKYDDHTIQLGYMKYEVVQLDDHTIFIGIDPSSVIRQKQTDLVTIKGSFKPLLVIEGNRLITAFMDVIPGVGAAKKFTNAAKDIHFTASQKGTNVSLKGTINFKDDAYALHELVKLLVALGAVQ